MRMIAAGLAVLAILAAHGTVRAADDAPGQTIRDCAACPEMVVVPQGSFMMGSDAVNRMRGGEMRPEGPIRKITIAKPFAVGKYEVTNKEFAAFVAATDYAAPQACQVWGGVNAVDGKTWRDPDYGRPPADAEPVVCVSWRDAQAYAKWLSDTTDAHYRLLTEAEWEYAAKAGSTATWPWGDDAQQICAYGNVYDNEGRSDPRMTNDGGNAQREEAECSDGSAIVAPAGTLKPNAFGLYDMIGNVWEWTEDCSATLYPAEPTDGSAAAVAPGTCEKRAVRSGSWRTRLSRHRPTFRGRDPETTASNIFGFRVARDIE